MIYYAQMYRIGKKLQNPPCLHTDSYFIRYSGQLHSSGRAKIRRNHLPTRCIPFGKFWVKFPRLVFVTSD